MPPRVGPYLIDRKLGSGGMGTVYLGTHAETGERAAVKVLPAALAREEGFRERFRREVDTVRGLSGPHFARYLGSGPDLAAPDDTASDGAAPDGAASDGAAPDGNGHRDPPDAPGDDAEAPWLAMEYLPGETLLVRLRRERRLPWRTAVDIAVQICAALAPAHAAGVVHRDLKPGNLILVPNDEERTPVNGSGGRPGSGAIRPTGCSGVTVKLVDFGVAQLFAGQRLTATGGVIGTVEFMAPEQAEGKRATTRSDLYSLGALLYAMLTGRPPFTGENQVEVMHKHRFGLFESPRHYAADCPAWLEEVVASLLAKDPADRPPDARVTAKRLLEVERKVRLSRGEPAGGETRVTPRVAFAAAGGETTTGGPASAVTRAGTAAAVGDDDGGVDGWDSADDPIRTLPIDDEAAPHHAGPLERLLESTWSLLGLLSLVIAGGWWWFDEGGPPTATQRFDEAAAILSGPPGSEWVRAREELLTPLVREDPGRWAARVTPLLDRVRRYEVEAEATRRVASRPPRNDAERFLRLAVRQRESGDLPAAARTLDAVLAVTAGLPDLAGERRTAEALLADLAASPRVLNDAPGLPGLEQTALARAEDLLGRGEREEARRSLHAILALYADDPAAARAVERARALLGATGDGGRGASAP